MHFRKGGMLNNYIQHNNIIIKRYCLLRDLNDYLRFWKHILLSKMSKIYITYI